jgi:hypothetical protein
MATQPTHIKSAFADTPVAKTRLDVMTMLERYGGTGFGYDVIGDEIVIRFTVPGALGTPLRVVYPINVARVQERLDPIYKRNRKGTPTREQAERVAWRNVYELVDAAFAAAAIGASTVEEAFHAHIIVRTTDGAEGRLYDYVEALRAAVGGVLPGATDLRALPRGTEDA